MSINSYTEKAEGITVPHAVIYYDADCADADGCGWCVELVPSSTFYRFPVIGQAADFVVRQQGVLHRSHQTPKEAT